MQSARWKMKSVEKSKHRQATERDQCRGGSIHKGKTGVERKKERRIKYRRESEDE